MAQLQIGMQGAGRRDQDRNPLIFVLCTIGNTHTHTHLFKTMSNPDPQKFAFCINLQIFYAMSYLEPQKYSQYDNIFMLRLAMSDVRPSSTKNGLI